MERRSFLQRLAAGGGTLATGLSADVAAVQANVQEPKTGQFPYRVGYVWLPHMSSRPFPSLFSSELDEALIADYRRGLPRFRDAGFNYIAIAGLIGEGGPMQLPADLDRGFSPKREAQIREVVALIHANGLKFLPVIGVYSWGFKNIIAAHPEVASRRYRFRGITNYPRRSNALILDDYDRLEEAEIPADPDVMCASKEESWRWQERVMRFLLNRYDVDGFHFESADRGRCWCRECRKIDTIEYHARINERTTACVKQWAPDKVVGIYDSGLVLEGKRDLPALKRMVHRADYFVDNTYYLASDPARMNFQDPWRQDRPAVVNAIAPVAMGEIIHHRDAGMERSAWFTPAPRRIVEVIQQGCRDGCRALEYYACGAFANPSRELNNYMVGHALKQPQQAVEALLETVVDRLYEPKSATVRSALADFFVRAEMSCLANDVLFNMVHKSMCPAPYLHETPVFKQLRYQRELERVFLPEVRKLAPELGDRARARALAASVEGTLNAVRAYVDKQLAG